MTNEEKIKSMSTKELAIFITKAYEIIPKEYFWGYTDTIVGVEKWLKNEHKEGELELL